MASGAGSDGPTLWSVLQNASANTAPPTPSPMRAGDTPHELLHQAAACGEWAALDATDARFEAACSAIRAHLNGLAPRPEFRVTMTPPVDATSLVAGGEAALADTPVPPGLAAVSQFCSQLFSLVGPTTDDKAWAAVLGALHATLASMAPLSMAGRAASPVTLDTFDSAATTLLARVAAAGTIPADATLSSALSIALARASVPHLLRAARCLLPAGDAMVRVGAPVAALWALGSTSQAATRRVLVCGQNRHAELGTREPTADQYYFHEMDAMPHLPHRVVKVTAGNESTVLLTEGGTVFTCGYNARGQAGVSSTEERVLPPRAVAAHKGVVDVGSCNGSEQLLLVTREGTLLGCGYSEQGQCGFLEAKLSTPRLVPNLEGSWVTAVRHSYLHTVILTRNGVFACGHNAHGQCGSPVCAAVAAPRRITALDGAEVVDATLGHSHSLFLCRDGTVFALGRNENGQCGLEGVAQVDTPTVVPFEHLVPAGAPAADWRVTAIASGYRHSAAVLANGAVVCWGRNNFGQVGAGGDMVTAPTLVDVGTPVAAISCGTYFTLATTTEGHLYVWGRNKCGGLGLGNNADVATPTRVTTGLACGPDGQRRRVVSAAGGFHHVVLLVEDVTDGLQGPPPPPDMPTRDVVCNRLITDDSPTDFWPLADVLPGCLRNVCGPPPAGTEPSCHAIPTPMGVTPGGAALFVAEKAFPSASAPALGAHAGSCSFEGHPEARAVAHRPFFTTVPRVGGFAVEAWACWRAVVKAHQHVVVSTRAPGGAGFALAVVRGCWAFVVGDGPTILSGPGVVENLPVHLVAVYADGVASLFVNGAVVATAKAPYVDALGAPVVLGGPLSGDREWAIGQFKGNLASVALYGAPLPPDRITLRYRTGVGNMCTWTATGDRFVEQTWYTCNTCGLVDSTGCCSICADRCHRALGHDVPPASKLSSFYCDCAARDACAAKTPQPAIETSGLPASAFAKPATAPAGDSASWQPRTVLATLGVLDALEGDAACEELPAGGAAAAIVASLDRLLATGGLGAGLASGGTPAPTPVSDVLALLEEAAQGVRSRSATTTQIYIVLGCLRLLAAHMAAPSTPPQDGAVWEALRGLLFQLANVDDGVPNADALQAQAASTINSGFGVLYPRPLDKAAFLSGLLAKAAAKGGATLTPAEEQVLASQLPRLAQPKLWASLVAAVAAEYEASGEVPWLPGGARGAQSPADVMSNLVAALASGCGSHADAVAAALDTAHRVLMVCVADGQALPTHPAPLTRQASSVDVVPLPPTLNRLLSTSSDGGDPATPLVGGAPPSTDAFVPGGSFTAGAAWSLLADATVAACHASQAVVAAGGTPSGGLEAATRCLLASAVALPADLWFAETVGSAAVDLAASLAAAAPESELSTAATTAAAGVAAALVGGGTPPTNASSWLDAALLMGGMEARVAEDVAADVAVPGGTAALPPAGPPATGATRNETIMWDLVRGEGGGQVLLERLFAASRLNLRARKVFEHTSARGALRAVLGALIKHCPALYDAPALTSDGAPGAALMAAFQRALLVATTFRDLKHSDAGMSYDATAAMITRNAMFLLQVVAPVVALDAGLPAAPPKLLRGVSALADADAALDADALKALAQEAPTPLAADATATAVFKFCTSPDVQVAPLVLGMVSHRLRAARRLTGLALFDTLLGRVSAPRARRQVVARFGQTLVPHGGSSRTHFTAGIAAAGSEASAAVTAAFFRVVRQVVDGVSGAGCPPLDTLAAIAAATVPYAASDLAAVSDVGLLELLARATGWEASTPFVGAGGPVVVHSDVPAAHFVAVKGSHVAADAEVAAVACAGGEASATVVAVAGGATSAAPAVALASQGAPAGMFGVVVRAGDVVVGLAPSAWGGGPMLASVRLPPGCMAVIQADASGKSRVALLNAKGTVDRSEVVPPFAAAAGDVHLCVETSMGDAAVGVVSRLPAAVVDAVASCPVPDDIPGLLPAYAFEPSAAPKLWVFGQNTQGELMLDSTTGQLAPVHNSFFDGKSPVAVAAGNEFSAVLCSDGSVYTAGLNKSGQCGRAPPGTPRKSWPSRFLQGGRVHLPPGVTACRLVASNGCEQFGVLTTEGHLYMAGNNSHGQIGVGTTRPVGSLTRVLGPLDGQAVTAAACSYKHSLAVAGGAVYAWGVGSQGQLGLGSLESQSSPVAVAALAHANVVDVATGYHHSLFLTADGTVWASGYNDYAQLGNGHMASVPVSKPQRVVMPPGSRAASIACGYYHSAIVTTDGALLCFGRSEAGQLGLGRCRQVLLPQAVPLPAGRNGAKAVVRHVTCGTYFTMVTLADGRVLTMGRNRCGQLGTGGTNDSDTAVAVGQFGSPPRGPQLVDPPPQPAFAVAAGFHHSLVLTGTLRAGFSGEVPAPPTPAAAAPAQTPPGRRGGRHRMPPLPAAAMAPGVEADVRLRHTAWAAVRLLALTAGGGSNDVYRGLLTQLLDAGEVGVEGEVGDGSLPRSALPAFHEASVGWLWANSRGVATPAPVAAALFANQGLATLAAAVEAYPDATSVLATPDTLRRLLRVATASAPGVPPCVHDARVHLAMRVLRPLAAACGSAAFDTAWEGGVRGVPALLLMAGGPSGALAAEAVATLRYLLDASGAWGAAVGVPLGHHLAHVPSVPEDLGATGAAADRVAGVTGALAVIGGHFEPLREGGMAHVVSGSLFGPAGQVAVLDFDGLPPGVASRYTGVPAEPCVAVVRMGPREWTAVGEEGSLAPVCAVSPPAVVGTSLPRVLPLLVQLCSQRGPAGASPAVTAAHWQLRCRAAKALHAALGHAAAAQAFMTRGLLPALPPLLRASPPGAPGGHPAALEVRWAAAQRGLATAAAEPVTPALPPTAGAAAAGAGSAGDDEWVALGAFGDASVHASSPDSQWLCSLCSALNVGDATECSMCQSPKGDDEAVPPPPPAAPALAHLSPDAPGASPAVPTTAKTWVFDGGVPSVAGASVTVSAPVFVEASVGGTPVAVLSVSGGARVEVEHGTDANGPPSCAYVNEYTVVLDVCVEALPPAGAFLPLLQADPANATFAEWYVDSAGAVGCGGVFGGSITPGAWHRLSLAADLPAGTVCFFVDGTLCASVTDGAAEVAVLCDDRWSLDGRVLLFCDKEGPAGGVQLAAAQLRPYAMSAAEVAQLGPAAAGGPLPPSPAALAATLVAETGLPAPWCARAVAMAPAPGLAAARRWLTDHRSGLEAAASAGAGVLEAMGLGPSAAESAMVATGSLRAAVNSVVGGDGVPPAPDTADGDAAAAARIAAMFGERAAAATGSHPGAFVAGQWTCCKVVDQEAPGCTVAPRAGGTIAEGMRVRRGPSWEWGEQDGHGFGTVLNRTKWNTTPDEGVRVAWDTGVANVYRFGFNGKYDVEVVCELVAGGGGGGTGAPASGGSPPRAPHSGHTLDDGSGLVFCKVTGVSGSAAGTSGETKTAEPEAAPTPADVPTLLEASAVAMRALFSHWVRTATAALFEHATVGPSTPDGPSILSLVLEDPTGDHTFLRDFLSAFPSSAKAGALDAATRDPVAILQRSLLSGLRQDSRLPWASSLSRVLTQDALYELLLLCGGGADVLPTGVTVEACSKFQQVWAGSVPQATGGATQVSVWRPEPPPGYAALSDVTVIGWAPPAVAVAVAKAAPDAVVPPADWHLVWQNRVAGRPEPRSALSLWRPVPPPGYVALGSAASSSFVAPPPAASFGCVAAGAVRPASVVRRVWGCPAGASAAAGVHAAAVWQVDNEPQSFVVSHSDAVPAEWGVALGSGLPTAGDDATMLWLVRLLLSGDGSPHDDRVFRPELVNLLLAYADRVPAGDRPAVLYLVAAVVRRLPVAALQGRLSAPLAALRASMEALHEEEAAAAAEGAAPFSAELQALVEVMVSVAARLHDGGAAGDARLVSAAPWFGRVVEVAAIAEALTGRLQPLPDSFLLAEDTFLRRVLLDETKSRETPHPCPAACSVRESVYFPKATRVVLKFDPRSTTAPNACLAVSDAPPSAGTAPPLSQYSGSFGGVSMSVPGPRVTLAFPVDGPSSAVAYSWDATSGHVGGFQVGEGGRQVVYVNTKTWCTLRASNCFTAGVHSWEIRVDKTTGAGNVFFGVCTPDANPKSYLGKDAHGWGWIGTANVWHGGKKKRSGVGNRLRPGDVIRVELDSDRGTLTVHQNGTSLGELFSGIPAGTPLFPAVAMYNEGDCLTFVQEAPPRKRVGLKDVLSRRRAGLGVRAPSSTGVEDVPPARAAKARELQNLGFRYEWCVKALAATRDDNEAAADWILTNMDRLDVESKAEDAAKARAVEAQKQSAEADFFVDLALHGGAGTPASGASEGSSAAAAAAGGGGGRPGVPWGWRVTMVPEYPAEELAGIAAKHEHRLEAMRQENAEWTLAQDESLVRMVNIVCARLDKSPLDMLPRDLAPSEDDLMHASLESVPREALQLRFLVLRNFNRRLLDTLQYVDLSRGVEESWLGSQLRRLRGIVFWGLKSKVWQRVLLASHSRSGGSVADASWMQTNKQPRVAIDRHKASLYKASLEDTGGVGSGTVPAAGAGGAPPVAVDAPMQPLQTVFGQLFTQLQHVPPPTLRNSERAWYVEFQGEHADDYGGPYREVLSQLADELMSPLLPLFILCPNGRENRGQHMDRYIPNAAASSPQCMAMFEFLGQLMGIAIRTKCPLELSLPAVVWKPLVGDAVQFADVAAVHEGAAVFASRLDAVMADDGLEAAAWPRVADKLGLRYVTTQYDGSEAELVPGGGDVPVSWDSRREYLDLVKRHRVQECDHQVAAIRRGLSTQVPLHLLTLFTWEELELMVCGRQTVDLALLKKCTEYGDGVTARDPAVRYFWETLEGFTDRERVMYLRFVWARSRLPLTRGGFTRLHKINYLRRPCFFSVDLPMYTSKAMMHDRLLYALTHCQAIDADDTSTARRAGRSGWATADM